MRARTRFGEELTALRLERGLSLRAVARRAGVSVGNLSEHVTGARGLDRQSDELVERVAGALEVDPAEAFGDYRRRRAVEEFPEAIDRLYRRRKAS